MAKRAIHTVGACAFLFAAYVSAQAKGLKVGFWRGDGCRSEPLGAVIVDAGSGCRTDSIGTAQSMTVSMPDENEDDENPFMLVAYTSGDCNPATIIAHKDSGCLAVADEDKNIGSYEVWDVYLD